MGSDVHKGKAEFCGSSDSSSPGRGGKAKNMSTDARGRCAGMAHSSVGSCVHRELRGKGRWGEVLRSEDGEESRKESAGRVMSLGMKCGIVRHTRTHLG